VNGPGAVHLPHFRTVRTLKPPRPPTFVSTSCGARIGQALQVSRLSATAHIEPRIPVDEPELTVPDKNCTLRREFGPPRPAWRRCGPKSQQLSNLWTLIVRSTDTRPLPPATSSGVVRLSPRIVHQARPFAPFNPSQAAGLNQFYGAPHPTLPSLRSLFPQRRALWIHDQPSGTSQSEKASLASTANHTTQTFSSRGLADSMLPTTLVGSLPRSRNPIVAQLLPQDPTATEHLLSHTSPKSIPHFDFSTRRAGTHRVLIPRNHACLGPIRIVKGSRSSVKTWPHRSLDAGPCHTRGHHLPHHFPNPTSQSIPLLSCRVCPANVFDLVTVGAGLDSAKNFCRRI